MDRLSFIDPRSILQRQETGALTGYEFGSPLTWQNLLCLMSGPKRTILDLTFYLLVISTVPVATLPLNLPRRPQKYGWLIIL